MKRLVAAILPFGFVNWYLNRKREALIAGLVKSRKEHLQYYSDQRNKLVVEGNYVNFGCGKNYQTGWINIDGEDNGDINLLFQTDTVLPFDNQSIDGIFNEHFIEHIDLETGTHFMRESYRVLKPGGVLRIICPNLDYILTGMTEEKINKLKEMFVSVGDFKRAPDAILNAEVINWMFYGHQHKFIYNFEGMRKLLVSVGFSRVELSAFGQSASPSMAIDRRQDESFYSLYVEAVK